MQLVGSGVISPESVKTQARQCLANIGPVLRVVRSNVSKIVSCICFVTDMSFALIARAAWDQWIKSDEVVSSTASPGESATDQGNNNNNGSFIHFFAICLYKK